MLNLHELKTYYAIKKGESRDVISTMRFQGILDELSHDTMLVKTIQEYERLKEDYIKLVEEKRNF